METDLFSIVIPCRNEEKMIGDTLQSIKMQTIVTGKTPVVVADANSTDNTLQIVQSYMPEMNITIVKGGLPPVGRNNGARYCRSKYVLFIDADIKLGDSDTLEKVLGLAEQKQLDLVIPKIKVERSGIRDKVFEYLYVVAAKTKLLGAFGTGMFICINNETYRRLGAFNEALPLGDDWELTNKIKPERFDIADAVVYTSNRRFSTQGYFSTYYKWVSVALNKRYRNKGHREYFFEYEKKHPDTKARAAA